MSLSRTAALSFTLLFPYIPRTDVAGPIPRFPPLLQRSSTSAPLHARVPLHKRRPRHRCKHGPLAKASHLAALMRPTNPRAQGASFQLALAIVLCAMRTLRNLTLPSYNADLLLTVTALSGSSPAGEIIHLMTALCLLRPVPRFQPTIEPCSLPDPFGVPLGPGEVPFTAAPHLVSLGAGLGLAVSLVPG